jgi:hypothetical protein
MRRRLHGPGNRRPAAQTDRDSPESLLIKYPRVGTI